MQPEFKKDPSNLLQKKKEKKETKDNKDSDSTP